MLKKTQVILSQSRWTELGCDDPLRYEFVRRSIYLGYGPLRISEWMSTFGSDHWTRIYNDVYQTSELLGIPPTYTMEKE